MQVLKASVKMKASKKTIRPEGGQGVQRITLNTQ